MTDCGEPGIQRGRGSLEGYHSPRRFAGLESLQATGCAPAQVREESGSGKFLS
jgi:hypothetical protein